MGSDAVIDELVELRAGVERVQSQRDALLRALEKAPPLGPNSTPEYHHWYTANRVNALRKAYAPREGAGA